MIEQKLRKYFEEIKGMNQQICFDILFNDFLLSLIDLNFDDIDRVRGIMAEEHNGKYYIVIETRTGGKNNRRDMKKSNDFLQKNKYYQFDKDQEYDSTYAKFYFNFPDEFINNLKKYFE